MKQRLYSGLAAVLVCISYTASAQQYKEYDILPGTHSSQPAIEAVYNNQLVMTAYDSSGDRELWISDGTLNGTRLLKNINTNPGIGSEPHRFAQAGGKLFFVANDGITGNDLWVTDGTNTGTQKLHDYTGDSTSINSYLMASFATFDDQLYFTAYDTITGLELWVSDGTIGGTHMLRNIMTGINANSYPGELQATPDYLYFTATDNTHGSELWVTDGTFPGTRMVKDIWVGIAGSISAGYTAYNGLIYFRAIDAAHGSELWVTDGTTAGTQLLSDILPGVGSSGPSPIGVMNGELFFSVSNSAYGPSLWKTDGTPSGTVFVSSAIYSPDPAFTIAGNNLYFNGSDPAGVEPWISDGTNGGTHMLKDIYDGTGSSTPAAYTAQGNNVYFTAVSSTNGLELYVTDGTPAGTIQLKDIYPGTDGSNPLYLFPYNNKLLFSAEPATANRRLYLSNGTQQSTILKTPPGCDNAVNPLDYYFTGFYLLNDKVYFTATYTTNGTELWSFTDPQAYHIANTNTPLNCTIYPNPATQTVNFDINGTATTEKLNIILTDITGQTVYQTGNRSYSSPHSTATVPLAGLAAGTYTYRIAGSTGTIYTTGKLVKQ